MTALRPAAQTIVRDACEDDDLTAVQLKTILKVVQKAVRQSKRVLSTEELNQAWDRPSWESLSQTLTSSEKFKTSTGLLNVYNQLVKLLEEKPDVQKPQAVKPGKRKADSLAEAQDAETPKKKKKSKKNKGETS